MAIIYNSNLTKELVDVGKLQVSRDKIPNEFADKIIPVVDVNPKHARITNFILPVTASNSASTSVHTVDSNKETYITDLQLSLSKDAAAVAVIFYVTVQPDYTTTDTAIFYFNALTLTAEQCINGSLHLKNPIRLKKGSQIYLKANNATGNFRLDGCIFGYTIENSSA